MLYEYILLHEEFYKKNPHLKPIPKPKKEPKFKDASTQTPNYEANELLEKLVLKKI